LATRPRSRRDRPGLQCWLPPEWALRWPGDGRG
jgi:hypothetical protein